jgi:polar amino acid transport system substrate-binding protein
MAALVATTLGVASCGDSGDATTSPSTLIVGVDATYPPNEFLAPDGRTVRGWDADLAHALGEVMGVKLMLVHTPFDGILPGLAAGKYDLGISSFTDTREREEIVDFVTYYSAGTSFFVRAKGGPAIDGLSDLCGHTVAVSKGTVQSDDAAAQAKRCRADGRPALDVLVLPDQPAANLALTSGRAEVSLTDSPVAAYQVKQAEGQLKLVGEAYGTAPYGIAIPKGKGLAKPILHALRTLIRNGTYTSILRKWGVEVGAIDEPTINGAANR